MKIVIRTLKWKNIFSYGTELNEIDFTSSPVIQLLGLNGHGKSSIALILEEVLFNKNSKGIKKANIGNRYTDEDKIFISLEFSVEDDLYLIESTRNKTQKITLLKNGEDISGHTATSTYKTIQDIIGMDHKTFTQIVYQPNASNLEFLKSADTARKKFLIELLNLVKYIRIGEHFKKLAATTGTHIATIEGKLEVINRWINKAQNKDLTIKSTQEVPSIDDSVISKIESLKTELSNIQRTNKLISNNNMYKDMLEELGSPGLITKPKETNTSTYQQNKGKYQSAITNAKALRDKMQVLGDQCPTCNQPVDLDFSNSVIAEQEAIIQENTVLLKECSETIARIQEEVNLYNKEIDRQQEIERCYSLFDKSLPSELLNANTLKSEIAKLEKVLAEQKETYQRVTKENTRVEAHNAEVQAFLSRNEEMMAELEVLDKEFKTTQKQQSAEALLAKVYSTNGIVAYKIESLVTDLENISNQYLVELSEGRFMISFEVSGDKLNVVITDNGNSIDIYALSAGELARVNIAVLLAIRKLTNSIFSNLQINLLFLDETISTLDIDGREKLIELLLQEEGLNTVLVSHGYTHPLLAKVTVLKQDNISRLVYD